MMKFSKTLLASSITLAIVSTPVFAQTNITTATTTPIDLSQSSPDLIVSSAGSIIVPGTGVASVILGADVSYIGNINNAGVITAAAGIDILGGTFTGNITNSGTITATEADSAAIGIFPDLGVQGAFTGTITNSGTIQNTATNVPALEPAAAIWVEGAAIQGGINNQTDGSITSNYEGILISGVDPASNWAAVVNGITNAGSISSTHHGAIVSHAGNITNGINNSGTISGVEGIRIDGLYSVDVQSSNNENIFQNTNTQVTGGITNSGTITSTLTSTQLAAAPPLANDLAMYGAISIQYGASVDFITNTGTIQSTGDAVGIVVGAIQNLAELAVTDPTLVNLPLTTVEPGAITGEISNSGTISSSNNSAIFVQNGSINRIINNTAGTISGGNSSAILVANGGSIGSVINAGTITGTTDFGTASGTFTNTGSAGNILGATAVTNSGTLGDITLATGGTYSSTGGSSGTIQGAASIAAVSSGSSGVTTTTINGNLTFGGILLVDVQKTGGAISNFSRLNVTGDADVTGATVIVNVTGIDLFANGDNFTFLTAGSLTSDITAARGLDALDTSAVLDFNILQAGNGLIAVIGNIDFRPPLPTSQQGTKEGINLNKLADALTSAVLDSNSSTLSGTNLGNAVNNLAAIDVTGSSGQAVYRKAMASLDPETVDANVGGAMMSDIAAASTINNRSTALRGEYGISGAIAGDAFSIHGFWIQAYNGDTDQGVRDGVDGFDADIFGIAAGFDAPMSERINIGLAFSYADTDVDGKQEDNRMSIDNYRLALYGSYNADNYYLDGQVAYAFNEYASSRVIDPLLVPGNVTAKGNHDGDQFSLRVRGGYPIALENGLYITPKAEMDYTFLSEDGYSEKGAGNLGLNISTEDVEVLVVGLGVKLAYPMTTQSEVTWIPELSIDYLYDTIGDEVEVDSNFIGVSAAAFITTGASAEQQAIKTSLRLRAFGQGNVSFSGGFDYVEKDDYKSQSVSATVRYDF